MGKQRQRGSARLRRGAELFTGGFSSLLWCVFVWLSFFFCFFKSKHFDAGGRRALYKCKFRALLSAVGWGTGEPPSPASGAMRARGDE